MALLLLILIACFIMIPTFIVIMLELALLICNYKLSKFRNVVHTRTVQESESTISKQKSFISGSKSQLDDRTSVYSEYERYDRII